MHRISLQSARRLAVLRSLHTTPVARKTVTEKVSEMADSVNKKLGKGLASALETGEQATKATKETLGSTVESAKQKSKDTANVAGQKMNQAEAGAREAKQDIEKEVRK
ncbi:hypothetical protein BDZ89DRAFT_1109876 [Hymenopellis radicata]|nr:hypothetical protein BDZ89DRAFT_1109876 [Hymenopellis radicata]